MNTLIKKILLALLMFIPLSIFAQSVRAAHYVRGDVNLSSKVDVADVTSLISKVLAGGSDDPKYDVNFDGKADIGDVTELIHYVLTGSWNTPDYVGPLLPQDAEIYTVNGVSFAMLPVQGGTFMMGIGDTYRIYPNSHASHQVTLSDFKIGVTEVTQALWEAVMGENPTPVAYQSEGGLRPVCSVSWNDCNMFIQRLNELTGMNFSLPTDAQWEFAARGGNLSQGFLFAGSDNIDEVAWYYNHEVLPPALPGLKKANELGLYDMSGNVSEWCYDDIMMVSNSNVPPTVDPVFTREPYTGEPAYRDMVMRGGNRFLYALGEREYCTVYSRWSEPINSNMPFFGMRLAIWPQ